MNITFVFVHEAPGPGLYTLCFGLFVLGADGFGKQTVRGDFFIVLYGALSFSSCYRIVVYTWRSYRIAAGILLLRSYRIAASTYI